MKNVKLSLLITGKERLPQVTYVTGDIRDSLIEEYLCRFKIDIVIHLAAIIPGKKSNREVDF